MADTRPDEPNLIIRTLVDYQRESCERLATEVQSSSIPLPQTLREELTSLPPDNFLHAMASHAGHRLSSLRESYERSRQILNQAIDDLLNFIDEFSARAFREAPNLRSLSKRLDREQDWQKLQKELFATTSAAHSLVDHTRNLQKKLCLPSYGTALTTHFGEDGLHEFVIDLRVTLHHLLCVPPILRRSLNFKTGMQTASVLISKKALKYATEQSSGRVFAKPLSQSFVQSSADQIDVRSIFTEYKDRANRFHSWFWEQVTANRPPALLDYDLIQQDRKKLEIRSAWRIRLGTIFSRSNPLNPHEYLSQYLTEDQIVAVNRLPKNSREQVDLVIQFADAERAITDDIRESLYTLFSLSTPTDDGLGPA